VEEENELERYFPTPLRERFRDRMREHRLRREIIATSVVNDLVNKGGPSFAFRLGEETGATPADIARAFTAAYGETPRQWNLLRSMCVCTGSARGMLRAERRGAGHRSR